MHNTPQEYVPDVLGLGVTRPFQYSHMTAHFCERRVYDSMQPESYCPHMISDGNATIRDFQFCMRNCGISISQRKPRLVQPTGLLEFVANDIVGCSPKPKTGKQLIVVVTAGSRNLRIPARQQKEQQSN